MSSWPDRDSWCLKLVTVLLLNICVLHIVLATSLCSSCSSSAVSLLRKLFLALLFHNSSGLLTPVMSLCLLWRLWWWRGRQLGGGREGGCEVWRERDVVGWRTLLGWLSITCWVGDAVPIFLWRNDCLLICMAASEDDFLLVRAVFP